MLRMKYSSSLNTLLLIPISVLSFVILPKKVSGAPDKKARVHLTILDRKRIEYEKAIEELNRESFKLKPRKLIRKSINPNLDFAIWGRRLAQGEVLYFKLTARGNSLDDKKITLKIKFGKRSFKIFNTFVLSKANKQGQKKRERIYESFLPISTTEKIGDKEINISGIITDSLGKKSRINSKTVLKIKGGKFKKSHYKKSLKVKKKYTSSLSKRQREIVKEQSKRIRKALRSTKRGKRFWSLPFVHPTGGTVITSPFWIQRFYNGKPGTPHSGTDFRGKKGHPVKAINNGIVVFAGNTFYAGKLIIIDHGDSFFSLYMHQSTLLAKKGEYVRKGRLIGRIGSSGLATGPHLHLGVMIKGIKIDPLSLLAL